MTTRDGKVIQKKGLGLEGRIVGVGVGGVRLVGKRYEGCNITM